MRLPKDYSLSESRSGGYAIYAGSKMVDWAPNRKAAEKAAWTHWKILMKQAGFVVNPRETTTKQFWFKVGSHPEGYVTANNATEAWKKIYALHGLEGQYIPGHALNYDVRLLRIVEGNPRGAQRRYTTRPTRLKGIQWKKIKGHWFHRGRFFIFEIFKVKPMTYEVWMQDFRHTKTRLIAYQTSLFLAKALVNRYTAITSMPVGIRDYGTHKNPEQSRTREGGTKVFYPKDGDERIAAFRTIVRDRQYAKIDGFMVDGFTASAVVQVYDAINETNKKKFSAMKAPKMASVAFKFVK
jgi:hypothetical protein